MSEEEVDNYANNLYNILENKTTYVTHREQITDMNSRSDVHFGRYGDF